jgi:PilZ domain
MENLINRSHQRIKINKCVSYNGLDVNSNVIDRYMGIALNISQNGVQLETDRKIIAKYILLMFFDYQSRYISTKGTVVYSKKNASGKFRTGISLKGTHRENLQFIKKLIKSYHYRKRVNILVS